MAKCCQCSKEIITDDIEVNDLNNHPYHRECWIKHELPIMTEILMDQTILTLEIVALKQSNIKQLRDEINQAVRSVLDKHYSKQWSQLWWYQLIKRRVMCSACGKVIESIPYDGCYCSKECSDESAAMDIMNSTKYKEDDVDG